MIYYAAITTAHGERAQGIYSPEEYTRATFSQDTDTHYITDLKPRTKAAARQMAMDIMDADRETVNSGGNCLSWFEWSIIGAALEKAARRFGLVREFRENGII